MASNGVELQDVARARHDTVGFPVQELAHILQEFVCVLKQLARVPHELGDSAAISAAHTTNVRWRLFCQICRAHDKIRTRLDRLHCIWGLDERERSFYHKNVLKRVLAIQACPWMTRFTHQFGRGHTQTRSHSRDPPHTKPACLPRSQYSLYPQTQTTQLH